MKSVKIDPVDQVCHPTIFAKKMRGSISEITIHGNDLATVSDGCSDKLVEIIISLPSGILESLLRGELFQNRLYLIQDYQIIFAYDFLFFIRAMTSQF